MSPTRRQLVAGLFGGAAAAALPTLADASEPNASRELFNRIEDVTILAVVKSPDTGKLTALQLKARGDTLTTWTAWNVAEPVRERDFAPDMAALPDWIAIPVAELVSEVDSQT